MPFSVKYVKQLGSWQKGRKLTLLVANRYGSNSGSKAAVTALAWSLPE